MKPIKFRAWDTKLRKMCHWGQYLCQMIFDPSKAGYELMQFTGLLDKNGVEIWEGDILHSVYGNPSNVAGVVTYRSFEFVVMRKNKKSWHDFGPIVGKEGALYEVIGNIYENPELLHDQKDS